MIEQDELLIEHPATTAVEFAADPASVLDRLARTGQEEVLTVDGEPRAMVMSMETYAEIMREYWRSIDARSIRRSLKEIEEGKGVPVEQCFAELEVKLAAMKAKQERSGT